nr:hypothetical protein [uncultured bacterium]
MKTKLAIAAFAFMFLAACGADSEPIAAGEDPDPTTSTTEEILGAGPYPIATLEFTVTHPDADTVTYTISCLGDTATVVGIDSINDQNACAQLAKPEVKKRIVDGEPKDLACTEIYGGPDEAVIAGTFDGAVVNTTIKRTNGCGIDDWDSLLKGVLPTALGNTE